MADDSGRRDLALDDEPGRDDAGTGAEPGDDPDADAVDGRREGDPDADAPDDQVGDDRVDPADPRARWGVVALLVVALGVLGAMWTLSSAIGSSPDDDFHLASIRCAWTAPDDACTVIGPSFAPGKLFVDVPAEIGPAAFCFAGQFDEPGTERPGRPSFRSAACQDEIVAGTVARSLANGDLYPGLYYTMMGVTVFDEPVDSALVARLVSWTINVALLAAGWAVLPGRLRNPYALGVLVAAVPHGVFLWASTNPSGVVVAAVAAAWAAAVALLDAPDRGARLAPAALLVVATVAAAGSRADGGLYLAVALVAACVLRWRRDRLAGIVALGAAGAIALTVSFVVLTRRLETQGGLISDTGRRLSRVGEESVLWNNLLEIPNFIVGNLGFSGLGWLDTRMPYSVWVTMTSVFAFLVLSGVARIDLRKALSLGVVAAGLLAVPFFFLWRAKFTVGQEIQARYVLPLLAVLAFTALYTRRGSLLSGFTAVQLWAVLALVAMAHSVALHTNIRRYVTGQERRSIDLDAGREWWWDIPLTPNMVWVGGTVAFAALAVIVGRSIRAGAPECEPAADRSYA